MRERRYEEQHSGRQELLGLTLVISELEHGFTAISSCN